MFFMFPVMPNRNTNPPREVSWGILGLAILMAGVGLFMASVPFYLVERPAEGEAYLYYVPGSAAEGAAYPLVIAFSPSGDAAAMIDAWKGICDRYGWAVLASRRFRNGIDVQWIFDDIEQDIANNRLPFRVDRQRILATGLSGGGMGSHMFVFRHPDLISGVIVNTGMIEAGYYYPLVNDYPRNKFAVFLASPTDFRYSEMRRDQIFLERLGWTTKWIEFEGGHTMAPLGSYLEACQWVAGKWGLEPPEEGTYEP